MTEQTILHVIHFNDVYNITLARKPTEGAKAKPIFFEGDLNTNYNHVAAFAKKIEYIRQGWKFENEERQGLLLFSGDLFSPSVESLLTRGSNMVHLMNLLEPDACVPGNHEFDYGRSRLNDLIEFCDFKWVLSNVEEYPLDENGKPDSTKPSKRLDGLYKHTILERAGLKIGIIGLMSEDTLRKINTEAKAGLVREPDKKKWMQLATELRQKEKCDLIFALTHATDQEDIYIAKDLNAVLSESTSTRVENTDGVDIIFGGHSHSYSIGDGVKLGAGSELSPSLQPGCLRFPAAEERLLIIKSGTDFEDLSEIKITVENRPKGTKRHKIVTSVTVTRHHMSSRIAPDDFPSPMVRMLKRQFNNEVLEKLGEKIATIDEQVEVNGDKARVCETEIGNWIADSTLEWYSHLVVEYNPIAFIMTGGSIRGKKMLDSEGQITVRQIIELLPFDTPLTLIRISGEDLKKALKSALKNSFREGKELNSSGSFPVVSGMQIKWNSTKPTDLKLHPDPVISFVKWIQDKSTFECTGSLDPATEYYILTNSYLADGNDNLGGVEEDASWGFKKAEKIVTHEEYPMYKALLSHIDDLSALENQRRFWVEVEKELQKVPSNSQPHQCDLTAVTTLHLICYHMSQESRENLEKSIQTKTKEGALSSSFKGLPSSEYLKPRYRLMGGSDLPKLDIKGERSKVGNRLVEM